MILSIIALNYNGKKISLREEDGFVNLTEMAKAHKVRIDKWKELKATKQYLDAPYTFPDGKSVKNQDLIQVSEGVKGGTWAASHIAINFARWISPEFATWCDQQIVNVMTKGYVFSPVATEQQLENAIVEALPQIHDVDRLNRINGILSHQILDVLEGVEVKFLSKSEITALKEKIQSQWKVFDDDFEALRKQKELEWEYENLYPYMVAVDNNSEYAKLSRRKLGQDKHDFWNNEQLKHDYEREAYTKIIYRLEGLEMGENRDTSSILEYASNPNYPDFSERYITPEYDQTI